MSFYMLPPDLDASSSWPYSRMPDMANTTGRWQMGMSAGGSMVIWPANKPLPSVARKDGMEEVLIQAFRGNLKDLKEFQGTFCRLGYEEQPEYVHQDGAVWLFNWVSGTLAQIYIAGQVASRFFKSRQLQRDGKAGESQAAWDAAWGIGKAFNDQIAAASQAYYEGNGH